MADETTITQITESAPGVETAKLNLIADVEQFIKDQVEAGTLPPGFTVADLTDQQLEAVKLAEEGVGSYEPFITAGSEAIGAGTGAITGAGMGAYEKASEFVDPSAIAQFFNPYEQQVVDQTLADLARQSEIEGVAGRARAAGAGAFGGSRMGVEEAERSGRLFDAAARTAGALRQQQSQNVLDAQRATAILAAQEPFQRLSFASGILTGTPASQMSVQQQPSTSPLMQVAGLGLMGLGAYKGFNVPDLR